MEAANKPPRRNERRRARDQKRWPKQKAHHRGKVAGFKMNSQEQSTEANSKAKPMIARIVVCHNCSKPRGPVCEDTLRQAYAAHDETVGFASPKFHNRLNFQAVNQCPNSGIGMVLGKMGHSARMAAWLVSCLQHLAHPLHVKVQRVVSSSVRQGTKTMMQAASVRTSAQTAHHGQPTAAKTTRLRPDAASLIPLIRHNLVKALNAMPEGEEPTLAHLRAITGPALRASTAIKRAHILQKPNA